MVNLKAIKNMNGYKFFGEPLKVQMIDESLGLLEQVDFDQGETNYAFS